MKANMWTGCTYGMWAEWLEMRQYECNCSHRQGVLLQRHSNREWPRTSGDVQINTLSLFPVLTNKEFFQRFLWLDSFENWSVLSSECQFVIKMFAFPFNVAFLHVHLLHKIVKSGAVVKARASFKTNQISSQLQSSPTTPEKLFLWHVHNFVWPDRHITENLSKQSFTSHKLPSLRLV